jgi:hypothetical protein
MKSNELRIGNWVEQPNGGVTRVTAILNDLQIKTETGYIDKYCRPIPLTEEWLLKFGFEKDEIGQLFLEPYIDDVEANIVFYLEGDEVVLRDSFEDIFLTRVHFIHQLQNLHHALTGKELKLKERQDA